MPASQPIETRAGVAYATHEAFRSSGTSTCRQAPGRFRRSSPCTAADGAGARNAFQFWGPYLAERGYALFAISYRLAKKGQKMFPQAVTDVLAAVQFVRGSASEIKVDPQRIALFGASAGAHLASLAALGGGSATSRARIRTMPTRRPTPR